MQRVFAIAILTLKEAYRKKAFLVLLVFAVALASSSAFFPVMDAGTRISLVKIWSVRAMALFSALIAIFLSSVSIPSDVEEKRIYTLVSKPVSKADIFLGKFIGFAFVVAIFLLVTAIITMLYIRIVQYTSPEKITLDAKPQIFADVVKRKKAERKEGEDKYRLAGNTQNSLIWVFKGLNLHTLQQEPQLEINLQAEDMRNDIAYTAYINVKVVNTETNVEKEFKDVYIRSNTPKKLTLPRELTNKGEEIVVEISRKEVESLILATSASVVIYGNVKNFELNYLRGICLVYLQTLIVLTASLMASTFLGGPVAIFFGIAVFFCGSIYNFVETSLKTAEALLEHQKKSPSQYTRPEDIPVPVVKVAMHITKFALKIIPDFKKFDFLTPFLENKWVESKILGKATMYGGIFIVAFLILGMIVIKARDFS